ncbi:hypothetical protein TNCV_1305331 [Trichonephila clavipes]|nr:hypothetical protein TNCV_1305331 [Trichonephila clavipes]
MANNSPMIPAFEAGTNPGDIGKKIWKPFNTEANGQIEKAVQTVKNSLTKAVEEGKDLYVVLLDYRIQPARTCHHQLNLPGRKLRIFLPSHPCQLKPTFDAERAREA